MASSPNAGNYVLMRNVSATMRLTAQHYLWSQTLGFNIHPDIPALGPHARVADIATGAGHWLFDVSRQLPPSVQLDGFDVSLEQCPPKAWLPGNVNLYEWDIYEDPPEKFVGQYDLVHIRLVSVAVKGNDPVPFITNLAKLLKPGGFLQWDEIVNSQAYIVKSDPTMSVESLEAFQQMMVTPKKDLANNTWTMELPQTLKDHSFQSASLHQYVENYSKDKTLIKSYTDSFFVLGEELLSGILRPDDDVARELRAMIAAAAQDAKRGAGMVFPQVICVAQKTF